MRKLVVIVLSTLLLCANVPGVAADDKFPEYPIKRVSSYPSCQTRDAISVAIEPIFDQEQQKKYFGTELTPRGFLPVLVVIDNGSKDSALLRQDTVTAQLDENEPGGKSGEVVSGQSGKGEAVSIIFIGGALMFVGFKMMADATKVKQNILVKELRSQSIAPGKTGHGFLYVPIGKSSKVKHRVTLTIPLSLDDKKLDFVFPFDIESSQIEKKK